MTRAVRRALLFAGWTLFVWVTRIRNAAGDSAASGFSQFVDITLALGFVIPALFLAFATWGDRHDTRPGVLARTTVRYLLIYTVVTWAIRIPVIWLHSHAIGFKVVHTALGVISVVLGSRALKAQRRRAVVRY